MTKQLHIDTEGVIQLSAADIVGDRITVLGISGSGKSNTAAVIVEEIIEYMPVTIVDIEGEYFGLREACDILVAGRSDNVDLDLEPVQGAVLARFVLEQGISVVLDLLEYTSRERHDLLRSYFDEFIRLEMQMRRPHFVVLEEAHEFIPQSGRSPMKETFARLAARGRKRGVGLLISSQRATKVDKDVMTQSQIFFLHAVEHPLDKRVYKNLVHMPNLEQQISNLKVGQAVFKLSGRTRKRAVVNVRERHTYHGGDTPGLEWNGVQQPDLKPVDSEMLRELRELLAAGDDESEVNPALLRAKIRQLKREKAELREDYEQQLTALEERLEQALPRDGETPGEVSAWKSNSVDRQQRALNRLIRRLQKIRRRNAFHIDLLFLLDETDQALTADEIAEMLGLKYSTVSGSPPLELIEEGLLERQGRPYEYRCIADEFFEKVFPDIPGTEIWERLQSELYGEAV